MGRTSTAEERDALASPRCKTYVQTWIRGNTLGAYLSDLSYDPFISGSIHADIGQPVQTASLTFHLGRGTKSLSPYLSTAPKFFGEPLIAPGVPVTIYTAVTTNANADPASLRWRPQFEGRVDTAKISTVNDTITLQCRDAFSIVQDHQISNLSLTDQGYQYGFPIDAAGVAVAMQQIIDKSGVTVNGFVPQIQVNGTPPLAISSYWQEYMGVLEALRRIGTMTTGWDLRGFWDVAIEDVFSLYYYDPDPFVNLFSTTFVAGQGDIGPRYTALEAATSLIDVRNITDVIPANDLRIPQRTAAPDSRAKYGDRHAGLSEDISSHIDTDPEAAALSFIMLEQLRWPPTDLVMQMPYYPLFQLNDTFQPGPDGYSYDKTDAYVVTSIDHTFGEDGEYSTAIGGSVAERSATREWLRGRKRMNQVRLGEPAGPGFEGDIWLQPDNLDIPTVIG